MPKTKHSRISKKPTDEDFEEWNKYFKGVILYNHAQCGCGKEIQSKEVFNTTQPYGVINIYDNMCKKCKKKFLLFRIQKLSVVGYKTTKDRKMALEMLQHVNLEDTDEEESTTYTVSNKEVSYIK